MDRPFVVLTALREEAAAILRVFRSRPVQNPPTSFKACHELYSSDADEQGNPPGVLAQLEGKGRVLAAVSTAYAIGAWNPHFLLIVGTAGGFERNGVALGDILVATEVLDYESQRLGYGPPSVRWAAYRPQPFLLQLAHRVVLPPVHTREHPFDVVPRIHFGPILSGDKVVASKHAVDHLLQLRSDALGVEMEGAGVALAAGQAAKPFLMVRGVADYADDTKTEDSMQWSARACEVVARFVLGLVELSAGDQRR